MIVGAGQFLVRDSKDEGEFVLSVEYKGKPTHHAIKRDGDVLCINGKKTECASIKDLIAHLNTKRKDLKWPIPLDPANGVVAMGQEKKYAKFQKEAKKKQEAAAEDKKKEKKERKKMKKAAAVPEVSLGDICIHMPLCPLSSA